MNKHVIGKAPVSGVSTVYLYRRPQQAEDIKWSLRVTMAAASDKVCYVITTLSTLSIDHLPYRRETHTHTHTSHPNITTYTQHTHIHTATHTHHIHTQTHTYTQTYSRAHTTEPN